jgi:DNA-binding response OmpR family regulator
MHQAVAVRPRVLCVDGDPDVRRVLRYALEDAGFAAAACGSGEAALAWIERHGLPDLAVVDVGLPGADGVELCRRIREHGDLPAILLTAVDGEPAPAGVLGTVAAGFMVKPFRPAELVARVRRTLRRAKSRAC